MKGLLLSVLLGLSATALFSQEKPLVDTSLVFDSHFTDCMDQWVVVPKKAEATNYFFGFFYLNDTLGFTLAVEGTFILNNQNKYERSDTGLLAQKVAGVNQPSIKYRPGKNALPFALMPRKRQIELGLDSIPVWAKRYKIQDPVAKDISYGRNLNAIGANDKALIYLSRAYASAPHAAGVELGLSYAYNALGRFDEAIKLLEEALKTDPKAASFYLELGHAYTGKKDFQKAIDTYTKGIETCPDELSGEKSEMAYNMAIIYLQQFKNQEQFKFWGSKAKGWAKPDSPVYQNLTKIGI